MEIIYPNKKELQKDYLLKYRDEFLKLNKLNIGDEIEIGFSHNSLIKNEIYLTSTKCKGILKIDENGFLYAESIKTLPFYCRRAKRSWNERTEVKGKHYFG